MAIDDWARAIASIESAGSGGYSALGPVTQKGNRAYGKYQVMDFNIGPWTEKYLGKRLTPQEFLASPEAQEAVFRGEFGGNVEKYGSPQEAASVWFTGQPMSRGANRKDILGTTGSGYIAKFNRALGNPQASYATPTIMTKGGQAVEPDQIKKDAMAQSTGIMGMAGGQQRQAMGGSQPRQTMGERFRDPNFWNELALAFHSMSSFPNEAAIRSLESRVSTARERKREQDQINKTIAFFEKANMPQLAELARVSPTAAINAYGQTMKPGYKVMTGAQVNQMYAGANLPADKLFNVSPTGQITQVGGGGVTVDMSGGGYKDKYWEEDVKSLAKRMDAIKQGGAVAAENLQSLQVMRDLYEVSPSGVLVGRAAELFPGFTDASAIVNSLRVSLAPKLRVEGSGSTSDIEYEGMLQSLGSFRNSPQANKAIIDLMIAKMELNAKRAEIASQVRPGGLDPYEAAAQIQQLETQLWSNNPLIQQVKELAGAAPKRIQQPAAGSTATPGQPTHRLNPQTRQVEAIE